MILTEINLHTEYLSQIEFLYMKNRDTDTYNS